jgi:hypothetical protein
LGLVAQVLRESRGGIVRLKGRPEWIFCSRYQALALRELGCKELNGAKLVGAREFVKSGQEIIQFHNDSLTDRRAVANHSLRMF